MSEAVLIYGVQRKVNICTVLLRAIDGGLGGARARGRGARDFWLKLASCGRRP